MSREPVHVVVRSIAVGGDGVGIAPDGIATFVAGALPGEHVKVQIVERKRRFQRADLVGVQRPSPHRRTPPCPQVAAGCGGCDWQHVGPAGQRVLKAQMVTDALTRLGRIEHPNVELGPELVETGYRTTVRLGIDSDGRAGFRGAHAHDLVPVATCAVAHPLVNEVLNTSCWGSAREVTITVGARTGERLVVASPTAAGVTVPEGVLLVGDDELTKGRRAWLHEIIDGRRFRVSARSFVQCRPDGADALIDAVDQIVAPLIEAHLSSGKQVTLTDLYAGMGMFAVSVAARAVDRFGPAARDQLKVELVERSQDGIADARVNVAELIPSVTSSLVVSAVERWRPSPADIVVADPARAGLGSTGVQRVAATGASVAAVVHCDAASLGRDARLLTEGGFSFGGATMVDLFPNTSHVEIVSSWTR